MERYQSQIRLPEIGVHGQRCICGSRVLVVGLGGLGCASATYLAASGVGFLRIVDGDCVEESNLGRQILFTPADIGGFKVEAGAKRLASMNPEIVIEPIASYLERTNIVESLTDIDVVVDGTDTVGARLLLNRALVTAQIPVIFGGATGWNGYVLPCIPNGPCYECVWTHPAERSCEEAGVLGPLVGTVGAAQAGEVIRTILGISEPGRLTLFDALRGETRTLRVKRRRDCSGCGDA